MPLNLIASIDVDPQQTFTNICPDELPSPEGHLIANALNQQATKAHFRVLTKDAHSNDAIWKVTDPCDMGKELDHPNVDKTWLPHAIIGTKGFQILPELPAITDYDFVVWKGIEKDLHPYGACFHDLQEKLSTGLIEWLKAKEVTIVIVGGLATDYCVKTTALQLKKQGQFDVWVNLESTRGISQQTIDAAIEEMKAEQIHVINTLLEFPF